MTFAEIDPLGKNQHEPGAKLDAGKLRPGLVFAGFAPAMAAVAAVGTFGARKYTDNGWLEVPDGIRRYHEAAARHKLAMDLGEMNDPESGLPHAAHLAWNTLAALTLELKAAGQTRVNWMHALSTEQTRAKLKTFITPDEPTPWYPDDSGKWVEVPADSTKCPPGIRYSGVEVLLLRERTCKEWSQDARPGDEWSWNTDINHSARIVAYRVVR